MKSVVPAGGWLTATAFRPISSETWMRSSSLPGPAENAMCRASGDQSGSHAAGKPTSSSAVEPLSDATDQIKPHSSSSLTAVL
jgi:hypothetical protein